MDRFVGLSELVNYSGYSRGYLRRLIDNGDLPAYRMAGKRGAELRVKLSDLDALMQPVIPPKVYADMRSRQPSPLHVPVPEAGAL